MTPEEADLVRKKLANAVNTVHAVTKNDAANLGDKIGTVAFANIGAVLTEIKAALQDVGLSLMQPFGYESVDSQIVMTVDTIITDTATGHYIMFRGPGFPVKGDPQAAGGSITYFRRYALVTLFGLIVEDDDGVQATNIHRNPNERTEAERMIREWLRQQDKRTQGLFAADFKDEFGVGLSGLPTGRHGDALEFQKFWALPSTPEANSAPDSVEAQG